MSISQREKDCKKGIITLKRQKHTYFPLYEGKIYTKGKNDISVLSEALGSYIAKRVYPTTLQYQIKKINNKFVTVTTDMSHTSNYMTMKEFYKMIPDLNLANLALNGNLPAIYKILLEDFPDLLIDFIQVFISDMFILNNDRCARNYGIAFEKENNNSAYISSFDFDNSIIAWDKEMVNMILRGEDIPLSKDMHYRCTPMVGLSDNIRYHQISDLISFCIQKDMELGKDIFSEIILKGLDELHPDLLIDTFERAKNIEINQRVKRLIDYMLTTRKYAIWQEYNKIELTLKN